MKNGGKSPTLPEALGAYAALDTARFHMPGHKGRALSWPFDMAQWDVTELTSTDNLQMPQGPILDAEKAWAEACNAKHSFFCVNGSTGCVITMLLAIGPNKHVLVGRDCHKSVSAGLAMANHSASFVYPEFDDTIDGVVSARAVEAALKKEKADAVFITSPNFYGLCADVEAIARIAHENGALLLVDSAHGAHLPFSPLFPESPSKYADLWCISAHKTLSALTQAAILHLGKRCPLSEYDIRRTITLTQTTSPSYLLMTSLDWALFTARRADYASHIKRVAAVKERIQKLNGITVFGSELVGRAGIYAVDPTRLVLDVSERGIDGRAASLSMEAMRVVSEMADARRIVFITAPVDKDEWYDMLFFAAEALPYGQSKAQPSRPPVLDHEAALSVRDAVLGKAELIPIEGCAGRIAAQAAGAYPPGIAAVFPGERITDADIGYFLLQKKLNIPLFGAREGKLCIVKEA
ncbi:MAG TPA: aminotransferase class V-fold PLP-dependent enzyme [Clostridia bacterium]|nr:aminotransferase class V-fold PLP-dependent enzyme [Clostridia bacterium]